jgi:hypothetical protein
MVSQFLGKPLHMNPALHAAPLVLQSDVPSSGGRAWPVSPMQSGTTLSGAGKPPSHPLCATLTKSCCLRQPAFNTAPILCCILLAAAFQIQLLCKRNDCLAVVFHVPSLIHSFPCAHLGFGLMLLAARASNMVVFASHGLVGMDSGIFWRMHGYCFSRPLLPSQMLVTIPQWSEWKNRRKQNPTLLMGLISIPQARM